MSTNKTAIKEIQEKNLEILTMFDNLCQKLNLTYTLSSGTLLGAVRHKGFIPWDDDIDIAMPREDYNQLIKSANENLPKGYFLDHYSTNKHCINWFAKIKDLNTTWIDNVIGFKEKFKPCLSLDIFPIDRIESLESFKKRKRKLRILNALRNHYFFKAPCSSKTQKVVAKTILLPIARIIGLKNINKMHDKILKSCNSGNLTTGDSLKYNKIMPYSIFETFTEINFEDKKLKAISNYEEYLKAIYGDYMTLPPPEQRKIHLCDFVDCNKPYTYYLENKKEIK